MSPFRRRRRADSVRRVFGLYALVSLVPVVALGALLMLLLDRQAENRGLAEARAQADLLARTAVAPLLGNAPVTAVDPVRRARLQRAVTQIIADHEVVRLRVRTLDGRVAFADDGSGGTTADDEAVEAAHGETISVLTRLNSDANDAGPVGPRVVEIYQALRGPDGRAVAVLEVYVPYAPIAADVAQGQRSVSLALGGGLALLWLALLAVSVSLTRRLRGQARQNRFLAAHDALTHLPNRSRFTELAVTAVGDADPQHPVAIAVIDLDRFKEINDTLGHSNGDRLLVALATRLRAELRPGDVLARLGGDEFGVILTGCDTADDAVAELARLRRILGSPVEIDALPLAVEASVGVAVAPEDGVRVEVLLQCADLAMYAAKRQHLGVARYRPEHDGFDSSALLLVAELAAAIEAEQLVLHYQPKGDLRAATVTGFEALVRWQHPTRGLLQPDSFLPLAEQTELIDSLTAWVLRSAASTLHELDPTGTLSVAVNISARSLSRPTFADEVLAVLTDTGTDPARIVAEITETALVSDPPAATRTLRRLHEAGIRIAIDDFGAGQTSLSYLATLPISELKIDKAFVMPMASDPRNAAIVRAILDLAHNLGFTVTAEGVESAAVLDELTRLDCDTVQGFLLARPVAPERLPAAVGQACAALATNAGIRTARIA